MRAAEGRLAAKDEQRERQLLKEHAREWFAPLDTCVRPDSIRFARGFLDGCAVSFKTDGQKRELLGHPLWATVTELDCGDMDLLTHPGLRSLRRATVTPRALAALAARRAPVPLEAVIGPTEMYYGLRMRRGMPIADAATWGAALEVGKLTALRSLELALWGQRETGDDEGDEGGWYTVEPLPEAVAWLLDSRLGRQLDELDLLLGRDSAPVLRWAEELARRPGLQRVRLRFTNGNTASGTGEILVVLELYRDGGEVKLRFTTNNDMVDLRYLTMPRQIRDTLQGLPSRALREVTMVYTGSKKPRQPGFPAIAELLGRAFAEVRF